jgi:hypothetical protein
MRRVIHHLKQRPDHHRRIVAFGVSGVIVAAMVLIWASTLSVRYDKITENVTKKTKAAALDAIAPPVTQAQYEPAQNESDVIITDTTQYQY